MCYFLVVVAIFSMTEGLHYKKMPLEGAEWTVFISKTTSVTPKSVIECGAACSAELGANCDLFSIHSDTKSCHGGYLSNDNTNYLTDDSSGTQSVFVSVGKYSQLLKMKS